MSKLDRAEVARIMGAPDREIISVERCELGTLVQTHCGTRNVITDDGEILAVNRDVPDRRSVRLPLAEIDPVMASVVDEDETEDGEPPAEDEDEGDSPDDTDAEQESPPGEDDGPEPDSEDGPARPVKRAAKKRPSRGR